jgi:methylated-DNA-[protein]-cysteine S-methyltransferase
MTMHLLTTTLDTPAGPFTLLVRDHGVCAAGFTRHAETLRRRLGMPYRAARARAAADLGEVSTAVRAYLGGELDALDDVPVTQPGDPSQQAAWQALRAVPAGQTISYRQLAERAGLVGDPSASVAAGDACARNNAALFVPCHRVLRSDGSLGGYVWGTRRKQWLLTHESALLTLV